jgi:methanethiol oxidase
MTEITDPTFYRTPADAITAAPESLAYVAAFDPRGKAKDAVAVLDCLGASATHGEVVGWAELPTSGNELHHFGWNACSWEGQARRRWRSTGSWRAPPWR